MQPREQRPHIHFSWVSFSSRLFFDDFNLLVTTLKAEIEPLFQMFHSHKERRKKRLCRFRLHTIQSLFVVSLEHIQRSKNASSESKKGYFSTSMDAQHIFVFRIHKMAAEEHN